MVCVCGESIFLVKKPGKRDLGQVTSVDFLFQTHNPNLISRNSPDKPKLKSILPHTQQVLCQPIKLTKNNGGVRSCHSQEKLRETGWLNVPWDPGQTDRHR